MSTIMECRGFTPEIGDDTWVAPNATIVGDTVIGKGCSIWFNAVVRGDVNSIQIGKNSNVQDHCMLHVSHKNDAKPNGSPLIIGEDVTVGHHVTLHGCTIGNRVLVGINTVILDDVIIEDDVMIGAGSLVPPRKVLKSGYLYVGSPVQQVRPLTEKELAFLPYSARHYVKVQNNHKAAQANQD